MGAGVGSKLNKNFYFSRERGYIKIKTQKNKEKEVENQIENLEKTVKVTKKLKEQEEKKQTDNERRKKIVEDKVQAIREDLKSQLIVQNKFGKQFDDMIEDYIFLVGLKEDLQYDISVNGLRYASMTGNGYTTSKPNESVQNLLKVNAQMLKILQDLDLKAPDEGGEDGDDLL